MCLCRIYLSIFSLVCLIIFTCRFQFENAALFNQNIGSWSVSKVTDMDSLFEGTSFDQDIGSWDVASVVSFKEMFQRDTAFNQDISSWTVTSATSMNGMVCIDKLVMW